MKTSGVSRRDLVVQTAAALAIVGPALLTLAATSSRAADQQELSSLLGHEIVGSTLPLAEVQWYCEARVPSMPNVGTTAQWEAEAKRLREAVLARWSAGRYKHGSATLVAKGPRSSTIALVASGLEEKAIGALELHGALGSLKEVLEQNWPVERAPELFCFGLLADFDIKHLAALSAPRPLKLVEGSKRAKDELAELEAWYRLLGGEFVAGDRNRLPRHAGDTCTACAASR